MNITETAIGFENAKQRAAYWLTRWTEDRRNERFLLRHVRALRACERLRILLKRP
jgi:hypothetical protein